ncbi:hypothetical protein [Bradyrhizobium liaoningense]|uniref:hypothetical protein n=2 Tax=Bradyrhizobium TaxID=374 RepID=UPI00077E27B2|nr:hypothetical protein A1D31_31685 [Bradyrhizobium liaoningense]
MASRVLYHGAEANKLLFNIRNGALTADSQGRIFFAERDWENCLIHGADRQMGESYAAKLRVDIPEGAQLVKNPTSGNPDARILKVEPGAKVPAKVEELYVRRGRVGAFETRRIPGSGAQAYLEQKIASAPTLGKPPSGGGGSEGGGAGGGASGGGGGSPLRAFFRARANMYKAAIRAGVEGVFTPEGIAAAVPELILKVSDRVAAREAIRQIKIKFLKEGFAKGVAAGAMDWSQEDVRLNLKHRVTHGRVRGLEDEAGILTLSFILQLAENCEDYAVDVGYSYSLSRPLEWRQDLAAKGMKLLKKHGYDKWSPEQREYEFIDKLAWAIRSSTNAIVGPHLEIQLAVARLKDGY